MIIKTKFKLREQVLDLYWNPWVIYALYLYTERQIRYQVWDGKNYNLFDEWQLKKTSKKIWYNLIIENEH